MKEFVNNNKMASVEEFMKTGFDSDEESDNNDSQLQSAARNSASLSKDPTSKKLRKPKQKKHKKVQKKLKHPSSSSERTSEKAYKESLDRLLEKDPEFKNFLKEHDADLLNFQPSSDDEVEGLEEDEEEITQSNVADEQTSDRDEGKPSGKGAEDSGEESGARFSSSDSEEDLEMEGEDSDDFKRKSVEKASRDGRTVVSAGMVSQWQKNLEGGASVNMIEEVIAAFRASVEKSGAADVESEKYVVEDRKSFNAIVRLCFTTLQNRWVEIFKLSEVESGLRPTFFGKNAHHKWRKYKRGLKMYLTDLLKLLGELQESDMICVTLKHIGRLEILYSCFPKLAKMAIKEFSKVWSRKEESCRVLAFLNINKLLRRDNSLLDWAIKTMYMSYVKNAKLVTPDTWPLFHFMQRSFSEVCLLDAEVTYKHAFVYIRQLAIHVRNAMISKRKELVQAVYNWQFVQCLYLWSACLNNQSEAPGLRDLVYPLIQVTIGCAKLIPSARYYPLRFHCARILIQLAKSSFIFVPVVPLVIEPLSNVDLLNKKHKRHGGKPMNFDCCLKLSKSQMEEKAFKDAVVESVYELLIQSFSCEIGSVGFPETVLPCLAQLKMFCKKCKIVAYSKQMRSLVDVIESQRKFVSNFRSGRSVDLKDFKLMESLEVELHLAESPLKKFYEAWRKTKIRTEQHVRSISDQEPGYKKGLKQEEKKQRKSEKRITKVDKEKERKKKKFGDEEPPEKKKKLSSEIILPNVEDIVQDFDLSDL